MASAKKFHTLLCASLALTLGACSAKHSEPVSKALSPESAEFKQYLSATGQSKLSAEERTSVATRFEQRLALLESAGKSPRVNIKKIEADVARIRDDMVLTQYFESLYAEKVSAQAIAAYYENHAGQYTVEEQELAHILIKVPSSASDEERAAAQTEAQEILSKIHRGDDFAELATEYTDDTHTVERGGRLGWVSTGTVAEAIYTGAAALGVGEVSAPVLASYGIHIIKKIGDTRQRQLPLERVKPRIEKQLRAEIKQAEFNRLTAAQSS